MNAALLLCATLLAGCGQRQPEPPAGEVGEGTFLVTDDDATIHLLRHAADGPPVLIVHGISSNHYCWDLDPSRSLGLYLAEHGYDAWLLDTRGHGDARHPPDKKILWGNWDIDDYALHDLPTAIDYILSETGRQRLSYVGHSLGGIIAAIYASQGGDDKLNALVVVGSPVDFRDPDPVLLLSGQSMALGGSLLPVVYTPPMARMMDITGRHIPLVPEEYLYNPANMDREAASRMMETVVSPLWAGEMRQFGSILREARFQSTDGSVDHLADMHRIHTPTLVIAGRADRVAPPDRVKAYYESIGSDQRRFVVAARENGFQQDYGHLDLPLGDRASVEIYPLILDWLDTH